VIIPPATTHAPHFPAVKRLLLPFGTLAFSLLGVVLLAWSGHSRSSFSPSDLRLTEAAFLALVVIAGGSTVWLFVRILRPHLRPVWIVALFLALAAGVATPGYLYFSKFQRAAEDKGVRTYQIRSGVEQFFMENPARVFAAHNDIVGPACYVKAAPSNFGEDYREIFPVRADWETLGVTMADGRVNLVLRDGWGVVHPRNGVIYGHPESVRIYQALLASRKNREGVHITTPPAGGRFETTWRAGVPDGPFRATYADGKLWAEATYVGGELVGRHVVYDRQGKIIYDTVFAPRRRGGKTAAP
jgi:hypothetical protein